MRLAVYARYSDDKQSPHSIDDQVRVCREHAARTGLGEVVAVYSDAAVSGASLVTRPEARRLLAEAREERFDAVLIESLDRISRDQEDIAAIRKRLAFADIPLIAVDDGVVTELHIGLRGTMAALTLKDTAAKVRRGQAGRALAGSCPGGLGYGYRVVRRYDDKGEPVRGLREIDPVEAQVVNRIYACYLAGDSPRAIAAALNRGGIKSPRGGEWGASTIGGGKGRRTGILWNEAYTGRIVYNRTRFVKDPDTGRRLSRPNPADRLVYGDAPELRIVAPAVWDAVQALHASRAHLPFRAQRRPRHAFSGLIRCGLCGAPYTMRHGGRLGCSRRHERGTCDNASTIMVTALEQRVIVGLTRRLLSPDAMQAYVAEYHAAHERLAADKRAAAGSRERRLAAIDAELDRLVDAIAKGVASVERVNDRMIALERERAPLASSTARSGDGRIITLHPRLIDRYKARIVDLCAALAGDADQRRASLSIMRDFVDCIEVGKAPAPRMSPPVIAHGLLPRVLAFASAKERSANDVRFKLVAGEGAAFKSTFPALRIAC